VHYQTPSLILQKITSSTFLNWFLPALGVIATLFVIIFVWRYLRHSNQAGRISEFNERTFKKLIVEEGIQEQIPFCNECHLPMRLETTYKDFLHDQGEFLIYRETLEESLSNLQKSGRIAEPDEERIRLYFKHHPSTQEHLFRRYKCPNCSKVQVLPYALGKESQKK